MHCHALTICQLPSCNLFTQHVIYLIGETPLVNCGPRSNSFALIKPQTANCSFFIRCNLILIFHTRRLILCFQQAGEIDNLTVKLGQSDLIVLCRFHVGTGVPGVAPHYIPAPTTFVASRFPTGSIKPWFLTEGKLAAVLIIPSSWGSQLTCDFTRITNHQRPLPLLGSDRGEGSPSASALGTPASQKSCSLLPVYCQ